MPHHILTEGISWRWLWRICLVVGLLLALLIPPFQSPDESNHFLKAWHISEGHFFPEKSGQRVGGTLPVSVGEAISPFAYLKNNPEARVSAGQIFDRLQMPLNDREVVFHDFANTAIYAPLAYTPQATAIFGARLFSMSPLWALYVARIMNFLVWWLIVGQVLNRSGDFRWFFLVVAALPATLVMAASVNPDVLLNALAWWCLAAWLCPAFKNSALTTALAYVAICLHKLIAWPLALLSGIRSKSWSGAALWLCLGLATVLFWRFAAKEYFIPYDQYDLQWRDTQTLNSGVDPDAQLAYMLDHPMQTGQIFIQSCLRAAPAIVAHLTVKFGWEKNYLHPSILLMCVLCLMAVMLTAPEMISSPKRAIFCLVAVLYMLAFAVTNYMLWHRVGSTEFHNWQGRYFTPILPLLLIGGGQGWLIRWKMMLYSGITILLIFCQLYLIGAIVGRYWII